jgi:enediyne biosynthesis protein E4
MTHKKHYSCLIALSSTLASCSMTRLPADPEIDRYVEIPIHFEHRWDGVTHPFTGAAVIDVDGDGKMEIFIGGGEGQQDQLFSFRENRFTNIIEGKGLSSLSATHGATSLDMDNDGDVDLLVARNDGVYLYLNDAGVFEGNKIPISLPPDSVAFDVAVSDIDHDGDGDLYISAFVDFPSFKSATYNDPDHAKTNLLLLNNGDLTFTDITSSSGTASRQNTFLSVFVDLDDDGWEDLVVAQNTGEVEIFQNLGDRSFKYHRVDEGYGFWMGLAVGDIDRDGDQDLFFTNVGSSIPTFLTSGDLRDDQKGTLEWMLLRNDGAFNFTNLTEEYGLSGNGFAWGAVFEDLNHDGSLDLLVAQNYIKWPPHWLFKLNARSFLQLENLEGEPTFVHFSELGLGNEFYGQSPLIVDIDNDGKQDILWINMDGPVRAFLNKTRGNYITVVLPDSVASLGTKITIQSARGRSYTRVILNSVGLLSDQTPEVTFGLGNLIRVDRIEIEYPNGTVETIENPPVNRKLRVPG